MWEVQTYNFPYSTNFCAENSDTHAAERLEIRAETSGLTHCHTVFNCTMACPCEIEVTVAIGALKMATLTGKLDQDNFHQIWWFLIPAVRPYAPHCESVTRCTPGLPADGFPISTSTIISGKSSGTCVTNAKPFIAVSILNSQIQFDPLPLFWYFNPLIWCDFNPL